MSVRQIWITTFDLERLSSLIDGVRATGSQKKAYLDQLEKELERAKVVAPEKIPEDVITMNSAVSVRDLESGEETTYTLVFPGETRIEENRISVLSAIGTALIGYRVGDVIEWKVPSGMKRLKVEGILYQPEASGRYDL
ncbi:MAG: nucleoside diphosphate kinase regulator [Pseudomonadota bacterium]|jgi:regulator of nucleoside diphosphate kinase|nr:nucleoside diphosphate kinase regulator [Syntrophaceae bacterium]MDI9554359.1 nucleoside diphosphate kinase regulator [Pseudomonadota bacterium]NLX32307.1 nucleoside diphosphate kinase regulator [Deltaproteobacteria bacterium]HNU85655.1 nucleoside diphosphate kinase regulator [Syntrophales bacterium]HNZ35169.1 nucleoside diphosphate kinase regulator [Syntrophales bacterium]